MINHRLLLQKYIRHVVACESIDFLGPAHDAREFSIEEIVELRKLARKSDVPACPEPEPDAARRFDIGLLNVATGDALDRLLWFYEIKRHQVGSTSYGPLFETDAKFRERGAREIVALGRK